MKEYQHPLRNRLYDWWLNFTHFRKHRVDLWSRRKNRWVERRFFTAVCADGAYNWDAANLQRSKRLQWDKSRRMWVRLRTTRLP